MLKAKAVRRESLVKGSEHPRLMFDTPRLPTSSRSTPNMRADLTRAVQSLQGFHAGVARKGTGDGYSCCCMYERAKIGAAIAIPAMDRTH